MMVGNVHLNCRAGKQIVAGQSLVLMEDQEDARLREAHHRVENAMRYSLRNATIGSTRAARRAGIQQAASATIVSNNATATK
ncbi:MAG: hypothetical protein ACREEM_37645, partial [Blastocatellia bacterium]